MFCDLRGFTTFSEGCSARRVIEVVNVYFEEMSAAILDAGGTLLQYQGDGIVAIFGAPLEQPDHADRAVAAAREMRDLRLTRFNAWLHSEGIRESFRMGIGLNTGVVVAGNVGAAHRVTYTVVGDTANTASRVEELTKQTGHTIHLTQSTREALRDAPADLEFAGEHQIRGRSVPLGIWTLASEDGARTHTAGGRID
jgi:adenylate cyclase